MFEKVVFFPSAIRPPNLARNYIVYIIFYQEKNRQGGRGSFFRDNGRSRDGEWKRRLSPFPLQVMKKLWMIVFTCTPAGCCRILCLRHHNAHSTYYFPDKTMDSQGGSSRLDNKESRMGSSSSNNNRSLLRSRRHCCSWWGSLSQCIPIPMPRQFLYSRWRKA